MKPLFIFLMCFHYKPGSLKSTCFLMVHFYLFSQIFNFDIMEQIDHVY